VFDLSLAKLLVLAAIALVIFGPSELPKIASQAGRALRDLRKIAESAKNERLRAHQTMPMLQVAEAHRQLETGTVHERIILTL